MTQIRDIPIGPNQAEFERLVQARVNGGMDRAAAVRAVVKANPELHAAYLAEYNASRGRSV